MSPIRFRWPPGRSTAGVPAYWTNGRPDSCHRRRGGATHQRSIRSGRPPSWSTCPPLVGAGKGSPGIRTAGSEGGDTLPADNNPSAPVGFSGKPADPSQAPCYFWRKPAGWRRRRLGGTAATLSTSVVLVMMVDRPLPAGCRLFVLLLAELFRRPPSIPPMPPDGRSSCFIGLRGLGGGPARSRT